MKETKETHLTFHFESFRKMKPNLENKIKKKGNLRHNVDEILRLTHFKSSRKLKPNLEDKIKKLYSVIL